MNQLTYVTQSRCPHTNDITHVVCVNGENRSIIERNRDRMLVLQYKQVQIYASKTSDTVVSAERASLADIVLAFTIRSILP